MIRPLSTSSRARRDQHGRGHESRWPTRAVPALPLRRPNQRPASHCREARLPVQASLPDPDCRSAQGASGARVVASSLLRADQCRFLHLLQVRPRALATRAPSGVSGVPPGPCPVPSPILREGTLPAPVGNQIRRFGVRRPPRASRGNPPADFSDRWFGMRSQGARRVRGKSKSIASLHAVWHRGPRSVAGSHGTRVTSLC